MSNNKLAIFLIIISVFFGTVMLSFLKIAQEDVIVYVMCHPDTHYNEMGIGSEHIAVQGKQLEKFKPESFSSIVLYAEVIKEPGKPNRHVFRTRTSGNDTCKTPMGMFEEDVIDNDLVLISKTIREYYGI